MPDIKLGPSGSETTLPPINWLAGGELELPVGYTKNIDKATMLNGQVRVNFREYSPKVFELSWDLLTAANIIILRGLAELNEPLHFQNNWVDATWRWVYITAFEYQSIQSTHAATAQYKASLSLEEII